MAPDVRQFVETKRLSTDEITNTNRQIHDTLLSQSDHLDGANFTVINQRDLENLFSLYDSLFFDGGCKELLGAVQLHFRLSKRMTQAAGKTS